MFPHGMTIRFWVRGPTLDPSYKPQMPLLRDTRDAMIGFVLAPSAVCISCQQPQFAWTASLEYQTPPGKWTFITITISENLVRDELQVELSCDGPRGRPSHFPPYLFGANKIPGVLGGVTLDSERAEYSAVLGSLTIFRLLDYDNVAQIHAFGPLPCSLRAYDPFCSFVPVEENGLVMITNAGDYPIRIAQESLIYQHQPTLAEALACRCEIGLLLPLGALELHFRNW
jgi:hypothetical protein